MLTSPQNQENHSTYILLAWIAASLFLHLFLLSVWAIIPKDFGHKNTVQINQGIEAAPSLTFMLNSPPPIPLEKKQERIVVPTLPSQEVVIENPNAILESERNTVLKSNELGVQPNSPLPQQKGDTRTSFSYIETPALKASPHQSSPPPTPIQPPSVTQVKEQNLDTEKPKEQLALIPDGIPLFAKNTPEKSSPLPSSSPKTQNENKPSPPESPMSFAREKSQINGAKVSNKGESSPESKATDLGRYKSKMYGAIGSRWRISVDRDISMLGIGYVKIKFFVQANGVIRDIQIIADQGQTDILEKICIRSIRDSGPFEPFSDNLKQQLGEGYWEDISFTIY